jgi:glycosyltransferase involved in cell wall biosynthesis
MARTPDRVGQRHLSDAANDGPIALPRCVVQVVLGLSPGGTERLVIELTKRLRRVMKVVVCCLDEPGVWASELTERDVPVLALGRRPGFRPGLGREIARLAEAHGASTLHCHHYSPFVYGRMATLFTTRLRLVFTEHGRLSDDPPSLKRRLVNPILGRQPGEIFAVSADLRRHMIAEGFPENRVGVIYNGIDPGAMPSEIERLMAREMLQITGEDVVVGSVARLDPVKNLGALIDAFALVRARVRTGTLVLMGDGPERVTLERKIRENHLEDCVRLVGHRSDVRQLLPALDIYANSSIHEGVSLTILEAMAASIPVVATRVGGTPEVVVEDETGILVPARSAEALARAIESLSTAPERRWAMGASGRRRVERHFALDRMVSAYLEAYGHQALN